jgi:hypothetical protein
MAKDPTKAKKFQDTLRNLLSAPPKQHKDMKLGKSKPKKAKSRTKK